MMTHHRLRTHAGAFTLIELLVVMSIIAILIAVLLPAVGTVRKSARITQATAQLNALDQGIVQYRASEDLGGSFPPSTSDSAGKDNMISDPLKTTAAEPDVEVTGAHLLAHALVGFDLLGPPGFRDLDRDGRWSNDTNAANTGPKKGVYAIDDTTGKELYPRYGSGGFVSDDMKEKDVRTLEDLNEQGTIVFWDKYDSLRETTDKLPLFVDAWDHPILYYKASSGTQRMIWAANKPGIYRQEDNAMITGSDGALTHAGIDFGAGEIDTGIYHTIAKSKAPEPRPAILFDEDASWDNTFAAFIWDPTIKARNTPVRKSEYLLISAGPDAIYGTNDDITNWTRQKD